MKDVVRILNPNYAKGFLGTIEGFECRSGRWIIKLEKSPFEGSENETVWLSLSELDFEVVESDCIINKF